MNILDYIHNNITYFDGATGTLLQSMGLKPGQYSESWNLSNPEKIIDVHKQYFDAGSNIVCTNTFWANSLKYNLKELEAIIEAAVKNVKIAAEKSIGQQQKFIAFDIGPLGQLLKPYGSMDFEEAVSLYSQTLKIAAKYNIDVINICTMNDCLDTKAALLAAKESCNLPVFVSNTYSENAKLITGTRPEAMVAMLEAMGACAIGVNCSLGPKQLKEVVAKYIKYASIPVIVKPNAGLPQEKNSHTIYDVAPQDFAEQMSCFAKQGACIIGGCCGTTPEYIKRTVKATVGIKPNIIKKNNTLISSHSHVVEIGKVPILIGERINPTGKKDLKSALLNNDIDYILKEALTQKENGVHALDVNVGIPDINEVDILKKVCFELQAIIDIPLQIDTSNIGAMEQALRIYNGKAMINSISGKADVMKQVFPIIKKYGGVVVCLTLDENGIPNTAEERVNIAKKIIIEAKKYGIDKKDLIFDTLAMTVSANNQAANITLKALNIIETQLKCHTILGISNISFGLPNRDVINSTFFSMALANGLSSAIINPNSAEMMKSYITYNALCGNDKNCINYIDRIDKYLINTLSNQQNKPLNNNNIISSNYSLEDAIIKGLKDQAAKITKQLVSSNNLLSIINDKIIPSLDIVGKGFENGTMFLPQLLMAAEASQCAFEVIKKNSEQSSQKISYKSKFVIATVKNDIHDIGKNIVKLILENYGFDVIDLGKDVEPQVIVKEVVKDHIKIVGLSALMTTTLPSMEQTIKLLKQKAPWCKICVGGAVLTKEYAKSISADFFAKDAMATVRYVLSLTKKINKQ